MNVTLPKIVRYEWQGNVRSLEPFKLAVSKQCHRVWCRDGSVCTVPRPGRFGCKMELFWVW